MQCNPTNYIKLFKIVQIRNNKITVIIAVTVCTNK